MWDRPCSLTASFGLVGLLILAPSCNEKGLQYVSRIKLPPSQRLTVTLLPVGPGDPLFAGSALHAQLWDLGCCEIFAVSDLAVLDGDDVSQGILIVANAWDLDEPQQVRLVVG